MATRVAGPRPRKELGQHFLRDSGILIDIAKAVHVPAGGTIVEIGAGTGQLTERLLTLGAPVVALEVETRLLPHLQQRFRGATNLRVVQDDARIVDVERLVPRHMPYTVAGNLPYFAASPIIRHFLESPHQPRDMVVMIQREVARRIYAKPGHMSLLAVCVQVYAEPEQLMDVPPEAFDPPPQVWSSVIRLSVREHPLVPRERLDAFFEIVSTTFQNPRKQLRNARWVGFGREQILATFARAGIDETRRPETLSIDEWVALLDAREAVARG
jgi:16S rRNA (adenine1518-N6/adenine1519-N6)-dimethyltransferase